jgi:hypothetical protein
MRDIGVPARRNRGGAAGPTRWWVNGSIAVRSTRGELVNSTTRRRTAPRDLFADSLAVERYLVEARTALPDA